MRNMAQLQENIVVNIVVAFDHAFDTDSLVTYYPENPAHIGGDYIEGYFYPPQQFASWTRSSGNWIPPKPRPDGGPYVWNEDAQEWQAVTE